MVGKTAVGPDGNTIFRLGRESVTYTYRISQNSINWDLTLRMNAIDNAIIMQNIGDGMMYTGYGLTLTGVGAPVGAKVFAAGNGISFTGSLIESAATTNLSQGGTSIGAFPVPIKRTPS